MKSEFILSAWPLPRDTLTVIDKCSISFSRQYFSNSFEMNTLSEIILIGFSKIIDYFFKRSKTSAALDLVAYNYIKLKKSIHHDKNIRSVQKFLSMRIDVYTYYIYYITPLMIL